MSRFILFACRCPHLTFGVNILSLKTNVEVYNGLLVLHFAMLTLSVYQQQPMLVSKFCENLSRFSVSLPFPTTYHFWHIRLSFSHGPICQRNRKRLLLWHVCQWLRLETRWVLILTQKQFFSIEEAGSLDQLSLDLCFVGISLPDMNRIFW